MKKNGELEFLAKLIYFKASVIVELELLNVGVKLNSAETERNKFFNVGPDILAVGVKCTETVELVGVSGYLGGNEFIYRADLLRRRCDRLYDEFINTCLRSVFEQGRNLSVICCGQGIEASRAVRRLVGNLIGVDVTVCINDH